MKKNKRNKYYKMFMTIFIINFLFSCKSNQYYKTFDYKTMSFKELTHKSENCVKLLTKTKNKVDLEVFLENNRVKRTFVKKKDYWYSEVKYELDSIHSKKIAYGGKFVSKYYIFKDHVVFNYDDFLFYTDLVNNKIYYFTRINNFKIENYIYVKIEDLTNKFEYNTIEYTIYFDKLYEKGSQYTSGGKYIDGVTEITSYNKDLDIFYLMDIDLYSYLDGRKFIYE